MPETATPVLFVHGLWLHAESWSPWMDRFRAAGYDPEAPGWPGEPETVDAARKGPELVAGRGVDDVVAYFARIIATLEQPPIVVGHSLGGLVAQRLLGEDLAVAAVALSPVPIHGVLTVAPSTLRVASVALRDPANRRRAVALTRDQFRYAFGNALTLRESDDLYEEWAIPSPGRPLFQVAAAPLVPRSPTRVATGNADRGPLLLVSAEHDTSVPPALIRATARRYRSSDAVTDVCALPGRGHSLVIDSGWREVADQVLTWLRHRGL